MNKLFGISLVAVGLSLTSGALAADPVEACAGCHNKDGVSTDSKVPTLAGMSAKYLSDTIGDYQKKARPCPEATVINGDKKGSKTDMCQVVKDLSAADIAKIAQYYSNQTYVKAKQTSDAALAAKGKDIHVKLCDKCHTEGGTVADDDSGFLGGQWMPYLEAQLKDFKAGKRPVPTKMKPKLDEVQDSDIPALVQYYGSVK